MIKFCNKVSKLNKVPSNSISRKIWEMFLTKLPVEAFFLNNQVPSDYKDLREITLLGIINFPIMHTNTNYSNLGSLQFSPTLFENNKTLKEDMERLAKNIITGSGSKLSYTKLPAGSYLVRMSDTEDPAKYDEGEKNPTNSSFYLWISKHDLDKIYSDGKIDVHKYMELAQIKSEWYKNATKLYISIYNVNQPIEAIASIIKDLGVGKAVVQNNNADEKEKNLQVIFTAFSEEGKSLLSLQAAYEVDIGENKGKLSENSQELNLHAQNNNPKKDDYVFFLKGAFSDTLENEVYNNHKLYMAKDDFITEFCKDGKLNISKFINESGTIIVEGIQYTFIANPPAQSSEGHTYLNTPCDLYNDSNSYLAHPICSGDADNTH